MSRIPATAYDFQNALRGKEGADTRAPVRSLDRIEPKLTAPDPVRDSDTVEVVQKFEDVYAELEARNEEVAPSRDLAEQAAAVLSDPVTSPARDIPDELDSVLITPLEAPAASAPATGVEAFELPEVVPVVRAVEPRPDAAPTRAGRRRRIGSAAIAATFAALVVGAAVGYWMGVDGPLTSKHARIHTTPGGSLQLRLDYALPKP